MTENQPSPLQQSDVQQSPPPASDVIVPEPALAQPPSRAAETQAKPLHADGPEGIQFFISVLVIVVFMITFVVQAFRVPSESMENTLLVGDFLLADKLHFGNDGGFWNWLLPYRPIKRGDIIVFRYPVDPSQYFVKRVIALPGDRIRMRNKVVIVNGSPLQENYVLHSLLDYNPYRDNFPTQPYLTTEVNRRWRSEMLRYLDHGEVIVPAKQYFVMGDNRDRSLDSRYWGFVPRANIMGRPLVIYLSVNDRHQQPALGASDDKLFHSRQMLAHFLQLARWERIFQRVR